MRLKQENAKQVSVTNNSVGNDFDKRGARCKINTATQTHRYILNLFIYFRCFVSFLGEDRDRQYEMVLVGGFSC